MSKKSLSLFSGVSMRSRMSLFATLLCVFSLLAAPSTAATSQSALQSRAAISTKSSLSKYKTIYFQTGSSRVGPRSVWKIKHLLPTLKKQSAITLTGYVQKGGSAKSSSLSMKRVKAVEKYLKAHGVKATFKLIANKTPKRNASAPSARRVEISWGSGSDGKNSAKGVIWSQEFNGASGLGPDRSVWDYDLGGGGGGNGEFQYYTDETQNSALDGNGAMVINATTIDDSDPLRENCSPGDAYVGCPTFRSARIKTQDKVGFLYGHIEARMWLPEGTGTWPAFWMLGADFGSVGWPDCGELDIMEQNNDKTGVHGTIHSNGPDIFMGMSGGKYAEFGDTYANSWHTYAINWKPDYIQWLVDGEVYYELGRIDVEGAGFDWVFDHENFIIINLAMGGAYVGGINPDGPAQMKIDYVRVSTYDGYGVVTKH
jgi:beta-glucanase (GH16 family)